MSVLINESVFENSTKWEQKLAQIKELLAKEAKKKDINSKLKIKKIKINDKQKSILQLYNIFNDQYQKMLEKMGTDKDYFPVIQCFLIYDYSNKHVTSKPSLDLLKDQITSQLDIFLLKPLKMSCFTARLIEGLMDEMHSTKNKISDDKVKEANKMFIQIMGDKQTLNSVKKIHDAIDSKIKTFDNVIQKYNEEWSGLFHLDLKEHYNIDSCRTELNKINVQMESLQAIKDTILLDIFDTNLGPFKNARLEQQIMEDIKEKIKEEMKAIVEHMELGLVVLSRQPQSIKDLSECKAQVEVLTRNKPKYEEMIRSTKQWDALLLKGASCGSTSMIDGIEQRWEHYQHAIRIFYQSLANKTQEIKSLMMKKIDEFKGSIQQFHSRWTTFKPKSITDPTSGVTGELNVQIQQWRQEWNKWHERAKELETEINLFSIDAIDRSLLTAIDKELCDYETSSNTYTEFTSVVAKMSQELWLSFRTRLLDFQDFYQLWINKMKEAALANNNKFQMQKKKKKKKVYVAKDV
ncbi:hypothetical protein RFI_07438 [Reticulomyxa filosa]|uniref:Dynein heavy chain linker domain-containing protein n=1 Tax=Reticulomyxa filosa TaxID=46433 RepID=X6NUV8_RETFI|nr:hypothetical protein RFI_07438 [Reticulomyxa filosa]|eukprot:ETO29683.1 hypothetical protein RFI_07438 [Reticulomyxa filosa]